jgi:poly(3-hydroxybutyrate) depolymerase
VQLRTVEYTAHDGRRRLAYVLLPAWYGPRRNPPLPLVISPHGRGANGLSNAGFFGDLPNAGFAVLSPDGMGRRMKLFSYGYAGQIDDLARLPQIVEDALPWVRFDRARVYAVGSSMGGQETALLVARHPRLLAGAAAMDSVTDLARRYRQLPALPCNARCERRFPGGYGRNLQANLRREIGGSPQAQPAAYAARSALSQARAIARSGVPLQLWWSTRDRIVFDQRHQSEALFHALRRVDPCAPVSAYRGTWAHSHELRASALLPVVLREFGLLDGPQPRLPASVEHFAPARCAL